MIPSHDARFPLWWSSVSYKYLIFYFRLFAGFAQTRGFEFSIRMTNAYLLQFRLIKCSSRFFVYSKVNAYLSNSFNLSKFLFGMVLVKSI